MKYTNSAKKAMSLANKCSTRLSHRYIGTEHLLYGLLKEQKGVAAMVLQDLGVDDEKLLELIEQLIAPDQEVIVLEKDGFTPSTMNVLEQAKAEAERFQSMEIGTEHLLMAILKEKECAAVRLLNTLGIAPQKIYVDLLVAMGKDLEEYKEEIVKARGGKTKKTGQTSTLDSYSRDLTALAMVGKLDPVIGRVEEINRAIQILSRRGKNNPCLIGEPGVGKSAIVEGLAQRIIEGSVPQTVASKRVLTLDLSGVVAGTKYRGEFEERIKKILSEVIADGNIILFIDEIHTLIGAGGAEGAIDASNILKPSLARGEIQLIGATTREEFRKFIEKDAALERRFQPVVVEEPSEELSIEILKGIKSNYEKHHHVIISDEAVMAAVKLSERYINERNLPDKAIDLMDEASAKESLLLITVPENARELEKELAEAEEELEQALMDENWEEASNKKKRRQEIVSEIEKIRKRKSKTTIRKEIVIGEKEIAQLVAEWTKVPVTKIEEQETARLNKLDKELHKRVIGQSEAVNAVVRAVKRGRVGLKDPARPIGSFLFLGPTGVGKTELSKALAEAMFGHEKSLIRVDMSEYMEKHSVSKMIGSPPGYVGYDEGGQLSEKVRQHPYSVLLFDEIEKAHPDIFNILLQVLDDGHITDAQGRKIDFKNTIIIMTSNAGAQTIIEPKKLGFGATDDENKNYDRMKSSVMEEVNRIFKPEFLNRIDETIVFHPLTKDEMKEIVTLQSRTLVERCKTELNISLTITTSAKEWLVNKSYDRKFGARPLKRMIQTKIEDQLAEEILTGKVKTGTKVTVSVKNEELVFKSENSIKQ